MLLTDKVFLGKRVTDHNGFVSAPCVITKVGISKYHVDELRRDPSLRASLAGRSGLIDVFRPHETVFSPLTIDSFKNKPVTIGHPDEFVKPDNAKYVVGGHVGEDVCKIADNDLGCTIHLHDSATIDISKGIETSAGYDCPIIAESGEWQGIKFDFRFDGPMIANHLALVPRGRTGSKVLDHQQENKMKLDNEVLEAINSAVTAAIGPAITAAIGPAVTAAVTPAVGDAITGLKIDEMVGAAVTAKFDAVKLDAKTQADEKLKTDKKVALHAKIQPLLGDKYDSAKTDHELLVLSVGDTVENADKRSDEYLEDKLDDLIKERANGGTIKTDAAGVKVLNLKAF
jgi:hypothetical protein